MAVIKKGKKEWEGVLGKRRQGETRQGEWEGRGIKEVGEAARRCDGGRDGCNQGKEDGMGMCFLPRWNGGKEEEGTGRG